MKTILFDFDYTLADSSRGAVECINYALSVLGESKRSWKECCDTIGLSLKHTYNKLTGNIDSKRETEFYRLFVERADQIMAESTELYEGVPEMVGELRKCEFTLGILSTKFRYRIHQILSRYSLASAFSAIVGGEDVKKPKPDPEGLMLLLSRIGSTKRDCVLVGDSLTDAQTARRGELPFIAVLTGQTDRSEFESFNPLAVLASIIELPDAPVISAEPAAAQRRGKPRA